MPDACGELSRTVLGGCWAGRGTFEMDNAFAGDVEGKEEEDFTTNLH